MVSLNNTVHVKEISNQAGNHFHSYEYYGKCILGGLLSCGLTHTAIVPLDVTKCKMQVFPKNYPSLILGLRYLYRQQGFKGLTLGWAPTLIGYSLQGMFKFGLYESFKDLYTHCLDDQLASKYKEAVWLAASASAETIADIALCPYEMVKVKMQTAPVTQELPTFKNTLQMMMRHPKLHKFPVCLIELYVENSFTYFFFLF
jgi:solute carrier family 25 (mitochondrial phosphate transporter), member 3